MRVSSQRHEAQQLHSERYQLFCDECCVCASVGSSLHVITVAPSSAQEKAAATCYFAFSSSRSAANLVPVRSSVHSCTAPPPRQAARPFWCYGHLLRQTRKAIRLIRFVTGSLALITQAVPDRTQDNNSNCPQKYLSNLHTSSNQKRRSGC